MPQTQIDPNILDQVIQRFQQAKHAIASSTHQLGESLQQTTTQATDRVAQTVTNTWQNVGIVKNTTSLAVQTAIASSMGDLFDDHPGLFRAFQVFNWAANHPIWSLIIALFAIAIAWSVIRAIVRLIETASLSILKTPLKFIWVFIKFIFLSLSKVTIISFKKLTNSKMPEETPILTGTNLEPIRQTREQRLTEISARLEALQKEQTELLQEVATILATDKIDTAA